MRRMPDNTLPPGAKIRDGNNTDVSPYEDITLRPKLFFDDPHHHRDPSWPKATSQPVIPIDPV